MVTVISQFEQYKVKALRHWGIGEATLHAGFTATYVEELTVLVCVGTTTSYSEYLEGPYPAALRTIHDYPDSVNPQAEATRQAIKDCDAWLVEVRDWCERTTSAALVGTWEPAPA